MVTKSPAFRHFRHPVFGRDESSHTHRQTAENKCTLPQSKSENWSKTMNRILIASAIATSLFAAPAFADCAADLAKAQDTLKTAKLDDKATASVKDLVAKATDAATKKDEAACAAAVAELVKLIPAK
jgi:hypothetical protein